MGIMRNPRRARSVSPTPRLINTVREKRTDARQALPLVERFFKQSDYSRRFCSHLLKIARGRSGAPWETRRLAILMLEHQILKLESHNLQEFDFLLSKLNLKQPGPDNPIASSVLREGFTTTELPRFIIELQNKLRRLDRVHGRLRGLRTSQRSLREFISVSRSECKLSLARYLFTPDEVVEEILRQLRITDGVRDVDKSEPRHVETEMKATIDQLPEFEARVLRRLCESGEIYWVSDTTSSEINSLVEYPITTVVLVVKLPGSDVEFEIKRAGRRGEHALNIVYARKGYTVPPSHRLDAACMQWLLRYEANHGSKLAAIYRLVHQTEAPIGNYISRSTVYSVPVGEHKAQTLRYFTEPRIFGEGFRGMRKAMGECIAAFKKEGNATIRAMPGELGLTAQFIAQAAPAQAIITGTSSFRLDKLARYLSAEGPDYYFTECQKPAYSQDEARLFADAIVEEVLGVFQPPQATYQSHEQYLAAVFALPGNRARADQVYLNLIGQIAKFWGTLLGVRGYSRGESFVARNVGLKSVWKDGQWQVRVVFMDHDALVIPNSRSGRFFAHGDIPNMTLDERYIWARLTPERFAASEVGCLQSIYRVNRKLDEAGLAVAQTELKNAYRKTHQQMMTNPELQRLFSKGVVERLRDWDTLVNGYLQMNGDKVAAARWKKRMKRMLAANGYKDDMFDAYLEVIEKNRPFLTRHAFLFESDKETHADIHSN